MKSDNNQKEMLRNLEVQNAKLLMWIELKEKIQSGDYFPADVETQLIEFGYLDLIPELQLGYANGMLPICERMIKKEREELDKIIDSMKK